MTMPVSASSNSPSMPPPPPLLGEGAFTLTVTDLVAVPPPPVQARLKVVDVVIGPESWVPEVASAPLHPPLAVHADEFWLLQVSVTVPPLSTCVAFAVSVTTGAGGVGATDSP